MPVPERVHADRHRGVVRVAHHPALERRQRVTAVAADALDALDELSGVLGEGTPCML
jgi:hypothetical protein